MVGIIKNKIDNLKLNKAIKTWRTIFVIKDPWLRRELEKTAEYFGIELMSTFDSDENRMHYVIMNVEGGRETYLDFIKSFLGDKAGRVGYTKGKVNGIDVYTYLD